MPPLADKTLAPDACALRDTDMLPPPSPPALSSFTSVTAPSFFTSAAVDRHHYTFKDAYVGAGVLFFCVSPHKKTGIRAGPAASRCFVFAVWRDEGPDSTESLSPPRARSVAVPRLPGAHQPRLSPRQNLESKEPGVWRGVSVLPRAPALPPTALSPSLALGRAAARDAQTAAAHTHTARGSR